MCAFTKTFSKFLTFWKEHFQKSENMPGIVQKQPSIGVLIKSCSGNVQQIYRKTLITKCDFNKVALQLYWNSIRHWYSPVNLLHFHKNTCGGLLLIVDSNSCASMENFTLISNLSLKILYLCNDFLSHIKGATKFHALFMCGFILFDTGL